MTLICYTSLLNTARLRRVIETGVAYGWSSLALLLSLKNRNGLLVSTDLPYAGLDNDPYVGCVVPDELARKLETAPRTRPAA